MATDNRTKRVMVNLSEDEFTRLEQELQNRRGRNSYSTVVRDALVFFFAYRDARNAQRGAIERHDEQPAENAPETAQDAPKNVCHLREV